MRKQRLKKLYRLPKDTQLVSNGASLKPKSIQLLKPVVFTSNDDASMWNIKYLWDVSLKITEELRDRMPNI